MTSNQMIPIVVKRDGNMTSKISKQINIQEDFQKPKLHLTGGMQFKNPNDMNNYKNAKSRTSM